MADPSSPAVEPPRAEVVPPDQGGARLDVFLARWLAVSRAEARRLLAEGVVSLDDRTLALRDKGRLLPVGAQLEVRHFRPPDLRRARVSDGGWEPVLLAQGPGWVAIDKPAGMPVHPLREDETGTALGQLAALHPEMHGVGEGGLRSGIVHRLDVDTSGVMLLATEQACWERLRHAFSEQRVDKIYLAIVRGEFAGERQLELMLRVAQHRPARVRVAQVGQPGAREVSMRVRGLELLRGATLVEIVPKSGFLHQIRAALAHIGHPLIGDRSYGGSTHDTAASRHMLHASALCFEEIEAVCDPPPDFQAQLDLSGSVSPTG